MENIWDVMIIAGPLLLGLAIAYAMLRNRRISRADEARSDRGTRALQDDLAHEPERPVDL